MKHLLVAFALLISLPVLAQRSVSIQPGSSVDIDGTLVNCAGSAQNDLPKCSVLNWSGNVYSVKVGTNIWGQVEGFESAIKIVLSLKAGGICS